MSALQAKSLMLFPFSERIGESRKAHKSQKLALRPIAPFSRDGVEAAARCFDRHTGQFIERHMLQTYRESLAQYHLSPESKFANGDYMDKGMTRRRHVHAAEISLIGKEANKWEEQSVLGLSDADNIDYGPDPRATQALVEMLDELLLGQSELAEKAGISRATARKLKSPEKQNLRDRSRSKIFSAISAKNAENREIQHLCEMTKAEIHKIGISELSRRLNCDPSNLRKSVIGQRKIGIKLLNKLGNYFG